MMKFPSEHAHRAFLSAFLFFLVSLSLAALAVSRKCIVFARKQLQTAAKMERKICEMKMKTRLSYDRFSIHVEINAIS